MPTPKFSFVPERQIGKESDDIGYTVSITKQGCILFTSAVVRIYDLDKKFIRIFADIEKRAVGWSIVENIEGLESLKDVRQLNKNVKSGIIVVSVKKLLQKIGIEKGTKHKHLTVKTYRSPLETDNIFYIQLTKEV